MWSDPRIELARRYLDALCTGDDPALEALMTEDFVYTDGRGNRISGRESCRAAAAAFHAMEPNYRFELRQATVRNDVVMLRGVAFADRPRLSGDCLLSARICGNRLCEWQVDRRNAPALAEILMRRVPHLGSPAVDRPPGE